MSRRQVAGAAVSGLGICFLAIAVLRLLFGSGWFR
jgi:hypothetical protein